MNPRLASLIAGLTDSDEWSRPEAWSRVALVNSCGRIPPSSLVAGDFLWNRGFNMLLLDAGGVPRFFGKCRPAADETLRRATRILGVLSRDPALRGVVPRSRGAADELIQVQLSEYLRGEIYVAVAARQGWAAWEESMMEILTTADLLMARASVALPEVVLDQPTLLLAEVAAPDLECLERAGLGHADLARLAVALTAAGAVPRQPQHGDLSARNVIRARGSWWVIDYDSFACIQVPLYDVFHLVRNSWLVRPKRSSRRGRSWMDAMARGDAGSLACRRVLSWAAASQGLRVEQASAALVYYLVHSAAELCARGVTEAMRSEYVAEVGRMSRGLRDGESLQRVFLGSE